MTVWGVVAISVASIIWALWQMRWLRRRRRELEAIQAEIRREFGDFDAH